MTLPKKCQDHLVDTLSGILKKSDVIYGNFLNPDIYRELLELNDHVPSKFLKGLEHYVGEQALSAFIFSEISESVEKKNERSTCKHPKKKLAEIEGFTDINYIAKETISKLSKLPIEYNTMFKFNPLLSRSFTKHVKDEIELSDKCNLLILNKNHQIQLDDNGESKTKLFKNNNLHAYSSQNDHRFQKGFDQSFRGI